MVGGAACNHGQHNLLKTHIPDTNLSSTAMVAGEKKTVRIRLVCIAFQLLPRDKEARHIYIYIAITDTGVLGQLLWNAVWIKIGDAIDYLDNLW